jgi:hypothetical protein
MTLSRLIPPILVLLCSLIFIGLAVFGLAKNNSTAPLQASVSTNLTIEGRMEKYSTCIYDNVCHYIIAQQDNQRYPVSQKRYEGITEIENLGNKLSDKLNLDQFVGKQVKLSGIWLAGDQAYIILSNLTSL